MCRRCRCVTTPSSSPSTARRIASPSLPEIGEGIRAVGILEMELYILGTRLVMIVDMPDELDWDEVMARLAKLPRQAEWEDHVAQFQSCAKGSTSDEKWQMMERIFHLYQ